MADIKINTQQPIDKTPTETSKSEPNYLIKVQEIVGKILDLLNRIAEKDRSQIDEMKKTYKASTLDAANIQRELGSHGLKFSLITMGASFLPLMISDKSARKIAGIVGKEFFPKLGDMFGANMQANMHQANSLSSLVLQEYSAKTSKGQSDASNKQEVLNILDKTLESLKRAAQAG